MSDFVVSARRYRPSKFDELIGQEHVSNTLKKALDSDKLAHAFLFCGPRGVGKTSCARILAKVINCENPVNPHTACNTCNSCHSFNENTSFNIIELDAASNNGVDNIRALNEQVRFQPQQGKYKTFIIDEVHMLSSGAFNAFLKTLEEPPPYAIFILATTEKHKIIPTILSRCQIFDFKRIQIPDIIKQLDFIVKDEGKTAEHEALWTIAQKADGAMRDALSIYDRISSSAGDQIKYQDVAKNLNVLDYDYFFRITDAFIQEDLASILLIFDEIVRAGFESDLFINGLSAHLRDLLVCQEPKTIQLLEVGDQLKKRYQEQALKTTKSFLLSALQLTNECDIHYPRVKNARLHVEICLAKIAYIQRRIENSSSEAAPLEKKTPDLRQKPEEGKPIKEKEEKKAKQPISHEEKGVIIEPISIIPQKPVEKEKSIPSIGKLDDLLKKVKQEESSKMGKREDLEQAVIEEIIKSYMAANPSPSLMAVLNMCIIYVADGNLKFYVPTQVAKETIFQEKPLLNKIRERYLRPDLQINIDVEKSRFPGYEEVISARPMTAKEKLQKLAEINPLVNELTLRFELRPDMD